MINVKKILKAEPTLTPHGIMSEKEFKTEDQKFNDDKIKQIETCVKWLEERKLKKKIDLSGSSSYGIKHIIEREYKTYVANGCFIAAVIHLGIPYKRSVKDSPNIHIPMSTREMYKKDEKYLKV